LGKYFYFIAYQEDFFNLVVTDTAMNIVGKFFPDKEVGENIVILVHPLQK
jgi:hypothetical protein